LETRLMQVVSLLEKKFLVGAALHPIPPSLLGFLAKFKSRRSAHFHITKSRDWFVIWMGLLSFLIAHIEFVEINHAIPDWFQYLVDAGIPQTWLGSFHQSGLCNFSRTSLRVGVFIDWLEKDVSRPRLEFFTCFNIPVWYPWTSELANLVASSSALANLRPPPEQLQSATTFILQQPSTFAQGVSEILTSSPLHSDPPALPSSQSPASSPQSPAQPPVRPDMSQAELLVARLAHAKTKPWLPFFQAREARNLEKAAKETPEARQTRLNRERKPPQNKVEVFIWEWSEEDPLQLVRIRVTTNRERKDALESHSSSQLIYNSWSNEWDLCDYFGGSDDDDDDDNDGGGGSGDSAFNDNNNDPEDSEMAHAAYIADRIQAPVSFHDPLIDNANDSEGADTTMTFDILDYLATHYGFVCPLSQQNPQSVDNKAWDNCMKALGRVAGSSNPPLPDFHESIIRFIGALQTKDGPDSDNFDAFPDNRVTINSRRFFDTIAQVDSFFHYGPHFG
jgi:hypothetical protein